jgi:DNA-binding beta-propeller fold protein YncE
MLPLRAEVLGQNMKTLLSALILLTSIGRAGTLYLPAYPSSVLVIDESSFQILDRIPLQTGTPMSMRLSPDHTKLYVTTIDHDGFEIVDLAARKVTTHFVLDTPTKRYRMRSGVVDPEGKFFYTVSKEIDQLPDHFEISRPKFTTVDLTTQKIVKTSDMSKEDELAYRPAFEISPDGKYLYQFGPKIAVIQTSDLKVIDHLDLAAPDSEGMENVRMGAELGLISRPGLRMSLFTSTDPIVHNRVFGLARMDLATRKVDYNPIGPAPNGMAGLQVTPDKKFAYTVVTNGTLGNKRCEFWAFDLSNDRLTHKAEVACRARFSLGMSSDGKKLYFYGAGFEVEVYDTATFKLEKTWDLNNDITMAGIAALP